MDIMGIIVGVIVGLVVGGVLINVILNNSYQKKKLQIIEEAKTEAEVLKKEKILQAKEKFFQLKEEHEKVINERNRKVVDTENRTKQKETLINRRMEELGRKEKDLEMIKSNLSHQLEIVEKKQIDLDKTRSRQVEQLEVISGLSEQEAKKQLIETLKDEAKTEALAHIQGIVEEAKLTATTEAKKIVIQTIQRVASEQTVENSVTVFNIESDDMKGRIIGREGRNIRALEAATGVEIIVDDTPEAIVISCFDPVRREIASLALHQLISDGRIHPARIEDVVAKTQKLIEEEMIETGKRTTIDLGIHGLHPELIRTIGKMKYRSSYGQNLLQHSREVANLCSLIAAEFGLNQKVAKRAGLLHDIGKVSNEDQELTHAIVGMNLAEKYKESPDVCNAIGAHHEEIDVTSLYASIVLIGDSISGARPGVRREIAGSYIKRLNDLEEIALGFNGVLKSYAIQAGRELRVMVESEKVSDKDADNISFQISQKIQNELSYPGQVKVTVIREKRAISYAK